MFSTLNTEFQRSECAREESRFSQNRVRKLICQKIDVDIAFSPGHFLVAVAVPYPLGMFNSAVSVRYI